VTAFNSKHTLLGRQFNLGNKHRAQPLDVGVA
jgi:hypothetical protein